MMNINVYYSLLLMVVTSVNVVLIEAFFVPSNNVNVQLVRSSKGCNRIGNYRDILLRSGNNEMSDQSNDNTSSSPTSIGDITQNLHGGKYQFSETQYLAGSSLMGQQFAESLYSSCDSKEVLEEDDDELPKWALKLQQPEAHEGKQLSGVLTFNEVAKSNTISVKNDERSWEQYFVYILPRNLEQSFQISPLRGHLAPRGGASNVCDASKPYSDAAHITINLVGGYPAESVEEQKLLVVGTEAEVWRYELNFE